MEKKNNGLKGFLVGLGIGAGLGVLFAPDKGTVTRAKLNKQFKKLKKDVENLTMDDVKVAISTKFEEIKTSIQELDKEEVLANAKAKVQEINQKVKDLIDYTKKEKIPEIEAKIEDFKKDVEADTKETIKKIEKKTDY